LPFCQGGVHGGVGTDFVVALIGPAQYREIADVDLSDPVLANGNFTKHSSGDGNGADKKLALLVDPGSVKAGLDEVPTAGGESDFLLQFAEAGSLRQIPPTL